MGLPGKPDGMDGGEVEKYFRDGRIEEIAAYWDDATIDEVYEQVKAWKAQDDSLED